MPVHRICRSMYIIAGNRTFNLDEFLRKPLFAHLATVEQGQPKESPAWFLWEDEKLWIIGNRRTDTFPARLQKEPKCAIGIVFVFYNQEYGTVRRAGFRGRAEVVSFDLTRANRLLNGVG